jgi:metal-responsive CopG/Arc/MetJ family transcriptional regulator
METNKIEIRQKKKNGARLTIMIEPELLAEIDSIALAMSTTRTEIGRYLLKSGIKEMRNDLDNIMSELNLL